MNWKRDMYRDKNGRIIGDGDIVRMSDDFGNVWLCVYKHGYLYTIEVVKNVTHEIPAWRFHPWYAERQGEVEDDGDYIRRNWRAILEVYMEDWNGERIEPVELLNSLKDTGEFTIVFNDMKGRCWKLTAMHYTGWDLKPCLEEKQNQKKMGWKEEKEDEEEMGM